VRNVKLNFQKICARNVYCFLIKMIFIAINVINVIQMFLTFIASTANNVFKELKRTCFIALNVKNVILALKTYIFIAKNANDV